MEGVFERGNRYKMKAKRPISIDNTRIKVIHCFSHKKKLLSNFIEHLMKQTSSKDDDEAHQEQNKKSRNFIEEVNHFYQLPKIMEIFTMLKLKSICISTYNHQLLTDF